MARPSKRTPEREKRLLDAIRAGNARVAACAYAGIGERTLFDWMAKSAVFAQALERAEAEAEVALVAQIRQAAREDWRAAAHLLACRFPERWAKREKVDITIARREAEQLAAEYGLDPELVMREAERIVASGR